MAGKKKEAAKSDKEFSRSNSLPSSSSGRLPPDNGDSSIRLSIDETNAQNSMLKDYYAEQIRIALLVRNAAIDLIEQGRNLHRFAIEDDWHRAKSLIPGMIGILLTANGDRVLHIAVSANSVNFVQQLLNAEHMTPQDLEMKNNDGNTAFCVAAISGNATLLRIMMNKNDNLPLIDGQDGMLPVHLAASSGHGEIADFLSSNDLLGKMKDNDIERLFLMTISSDLFYVAIKLFDKRKYRDLLAIARADEKLTALQILARKPSVFSSVDSAGMKLFKEVWGHVRKLEYREMLRQTDNPWTVLLDSIQLGNDDAARWILIENPGLLTLKDSDGRNPLHYAALYRRESMLRYILKQRTVNLIIRGVDSEHNNVLHLAASYQSHEALSRLDTKMQRELAWFKEVEKRVPKDLMTMKNNKDQTPKDIFYASHRELSKEVKETAKGIANSGMLVAALIATVAFAAALTVPGDKTSARFVVFILTNTVALFASSASIISFLSIFTSAWFIDNEFIISQTLIKLGLVLLVVSLVTMVLSFAAASFLIFGHIFKWVAYVVVSMGVLPTLLLLVLRYKYVDRLYNYFDRLCNYSWSRISYRTIRQQISGCNFKSSSTAEDSV